MALKTQVQSLKQNWLVLVAVLVVVVLATTLTSNFSTQSFSNKLDVQESLAVGYGRASSFIPPSYGGDFAPEVQERVIAKTASLTTEIEYGEFEKENQKAKNILSTADAIILNENMNRYGTGKQQYFSANYEIKTETAKYDALLAQLKEAGKITYFNENQEDITKQKVSLEAELAAELERLTRYKELQEKDISLQEQLELTDRIFQQERTINYLEEALKNVNARVSYSTIYFTLQEKPSDFSNIIWVTFGNLARSFVESINALLHLIFLIIPWGVALAIIVFITRAVRKRR